MKWRAVVRHGGAAVLFVWTFLAVREFVAVHVFGRGCPVHVCGPNSGPGFAGVCLAVVSVFAYYELTDYRRIKK